MSDVTESQSTKTTPPKTSAAFPTAVNSQITDSITQANTKVLGDAPAVAMGNLYQATAQALSNAAHNATNAQQQSYVTSQATTTMGVATLYSVDTASTGVATQDIFLAKTEPQSAEAIQTRLDEVLGTLDVSGPQSAAHARVADVLHHHSGGIHTAEEFASAMHVTMSEFAESLHALDDSLYVQQLHTIQNAATASCLAAMIKTPEQTQNYERILEIIRNLGHRD